MIFTLASGAPDAAPPSAPPTPDPPSRSVIIAAAKTVMAKARYATLVTLDGHGEPQARVVDPFAPDEDLTIWIATNALSRKVQQVSADHRATLLYFDAASQHYVTLIGAAALVRDPQEKAKHWKDEWVAFYKDTYRGDDYVLIRVTPARLEVVAASLGMTSDPATWRPVVLDLK